MRLIDADVFAERLLMVWDTADKEKKAEISAVISNVVTPILVGTPTAYDIDKVVEQLEAELYKGMESLDPVLISFNFGINKAIEIVKRGAKWVG